MKLPIRLSGNDHDELHKALVAVTQRLDRLIELTERTNVLLQSVPLTTRSEAKAVDATQTLDDRGLTAASPRGTRRARGRRRAKTSSLRRRRVAGLHDVIAAVLQDAGEPLTAAQIAQRINDQRLFAPPRQWKAARCQSDQLAHLQRTLPESVPP